MTTRQPATPTLRVAAAQAASVAGDVEANVATAVSLAETAAARGARLVVLPELFLTGYAPQTWSLETALPTDDPRLEPLRKAAVDHDLVVAAGAAVLREDNGSAHATLSILVVDATGEVSAPYDKQHLYAAERGFFTPGDHGASVVLDGWELGLGVCYDGCFPEHAAAAAADGALAYVCPAAYFAGADHRRDLYYAARALDNGIYVVLSGLTGECGGLHFGGGSAVYDPEGRPLERVGAEAAAVVAVDLVASEVARVQRENPIAADRLAALGERTRLSLR